MPGRFPLVAVPLVDDPFCSHGFCQDNQDNQNVFNPYIYTHARFTNVSWTQPGAAPTNASASTSWLSLAGGSYIGIEIFPGAIPVTPYGVPGYAFVPWGNNITLLLDCSRENQPTCGFSTQTALSVYFLNSAGILGFFQLPGTGAYSVFGPSGTFAGSVNGIYQFTNGPFSQGLLVGPILAQWVGITYTGSYPSLS